MRVIQLKEARVEEGPNGGFFFISRFGNQYGPYVDMHTAIHKGNIEAADDHAAWLPPVGTAPAYISPNRKDTTNE